MESMIVLAVLLFFMLAIGVPVGFAIGGATMAAIYFCTDLNMIINAQYCYSGINSFTVMAIPFFMLAGIIMSTGGIAKRIVNFAHSLIGFITGSLGCVTILACMFFGALSGSGMATASAIGGMMIPELKRKGYNDSYAATLVSFGGIVGPIIPPSLSFVLYGATTGTSVPQLFLAGVLPGVLIGLAFLALNIFLCRRWGTDLKNAALIEAMGSDSAEESESAMGSEGNRSLSPKNIFCSRVRDIGVSFKDGFWALMSPVVILGGIYSGMFTPTEAACVSVVYSILVSVFIYREMTWKGLFDTFLAAAVLNGITSFLLGYSTVFSTFMTAEQIPQAITAFLTGISDSKFVILLLINGMLLVVGCFLDTVPAIIVMAPMLLPTVEALGVNPVHFGVVMAVNLALGLCTPPYGCNLFVGAAVAKIKMESMFKYLIPFFIVGLASLMLLTYVPKLSLLFL